MFKTSYPITKNLVTIVVAPKTDGSYLVYAHGCIAWGIDTDNPDAAVREMAYTFREDKSLRYLGGLTWEVMEDA